MKGIFILTFSLFISLISCKSGQNSGEPNAVKERSGRTDMPDKEERRDIYDTDDKTTNDVEKEDDSKDTDQDDDDLKINLNLGQGELLPTNQLKEVFPASLDGMKREDFEAEKTGAFGFKLSNVKAEYANDHRSIHLELIDFGGMPTLAKWIAKWSDSDIFHEDKNGYEKVVEWHGYKAFEKSDTKHHTSSIAVLYKDRLLVSGRAEDISIEDLKKILDQNVLGKLNDLKWK